MRRALKPGIALFALTLLLLLLPLSAVAESIGRFTAVSGRVDVLRGGQLPAEPVKVGDSVAVGDIVRTKSRSKAEVTMTDGNVLTVSPRSRLDVSYYAPGKEAAFDLPRGKVKASVPRLETGSDAIRFEIRTPNAVAGVRGTEFSVAFRRNATSIRVVEGQVYTFSQANPEQVVEVPAGFGLVVTGDEPADESGMFEAGPDPEDGTENDGGDGEADAGGEGEEDAQGDDASDAEGEESSGDSSGEETSAGGMEEGSQDSGDDLSGDDGSLEGTSEGDLSGDGLPQEGETAVDDGSTGDSGTTDDTLLDPVETELISDDSIDPIEPVTSPDTTAGGGSIETSTDPAPVIPIDDVVDNIPPVVTVSASARPRVDSSLLDMHVVIGTDEPAIVTWSIDGGAGTGLSEGVHTLEWSAVDASGNEAVGSRTFSLQHYALSGPAVTGGEPVSSGGLAVVPEYITWSGWQIRNTGTYQDPAEIPLSFEILSGGQASGRSSSGYWLDWITGTKDEATQTLSGSSKLVLLDRFVHGSGLGSATGRYGGGTWELDDIGSNYREQPLSFVSEFGFDGTTGGIRGLLGGTGSPWSASAAMSLIGESFLGSWASGVVATGIRSHDFKLLTDTTYDGGAYQGFLAFGGRNDALRGSLLALYIDPQGNAGYLKGSLSGTQYAGIGMLGLDGTVAPTAMGSAGALAAADLSRSVESTLDFVEFAGSLAGGEFLYDGSGEMRVLTMADQTNRAAMNWGLFMLDSAGTASTTGTASGSWAARTGGFGRFGLVSSQAGNLAGDQGFWLGTIAGSALDGDLSGTMSGTFLTGRRLGSLTGRSNVGTFDPVTGAWRNTVLGTYEAVDLLAGSRFVESFAAGDLDLFLGTTDSLGTGGNATFHAIGEYFPWEAGVWLKSDVWSQNDLNLTETTYEGGAYRGFFLGSESAGEIDAGLLALYISPDGDAGILKTTLSGRMADGTSLFHLTGSGQSASLTPAAGIQPTQLLASMLFDSEPITTASGVFGAGGTIDRNTTGMHTLDSMSLNGIDDWGVAAVQLDGSYGGPVSDDWRMKVDADGDPSFRMVAEVEGDLWDESTGKLHGSTKGFWVDTAVDAATGIYIGETVGTFDPNDLAGPVWKTVTGGTWMETGKYLALASTAAGQGELGKLGIPAVEIGSGTFSGSYSDGAGNSLDITLGNVRYFAPTSGDPASLWATDAVFGNYTGAPVSASVPLALQGGASNVSGLNPTLQMVQWNDVGGGAGNWRGDVTTPTGGTIGGYGNQLMNGAAAGTFGAGSLTGTASGTVD